MLLRIDHPCAYTHAQNFHFLLSNSRKRPIGRLQGPYMLLCASFPWQTGRPHAPEANLLSILIDLFEDSEYIDNTAILYIEFLNTILSRCSHIEHGIFDIGVQLSRKERWLVYVNSPRKINLLRCPNISQPPRIRVSSPRLKRFSHFVAYQQPETRSNNISRARTQDLHNTPAERGSLISSHERTCNLQSWCSSGLHLPPTLFRRKRQCNALTLRYPGARHGLEGRSQNHN